MFDKEESNKRKKIKLNNINYQKVGKFILTSSLIMLMANPYNAQTLKSDSSTDEFYKVFTEYKERLYHYKNTRNYNDKIIDIYNNYQIKIDNTVYPMEKYYILFNSKNEDPKFHLMNIRCEYEDILTSSYEKYEYDTSIKFRNTTAFINLIESDYVNIDDDKKIIEIINKEKALELINNWDGMLHSLVPETDAIKDKNILGR